MAPPRLRWQTSNCSLLIIYLPRKDERLSRPGWPRLIVLEKRQQNKFVAVVTCYSIYLEKSFDLSNVLAYHEGRSACIVTYLLLQVLHSKNYMCMRLWSANSSFTIAGPAAWNALPAHIRTIDSHSAFYRHIKTYLFTVPGWLSLTVGLYLLCTLNLLAGKCLLNCILFYLFYFKQCHCKALPSTGWAAP